MRIVLFTSAFMVLAVCAVGQNLSSQSETPVHVRRLTLVASDLPAANRQQIASSLEGGTYAPTGLAKRIRRSLLDQGYFQARTDDPRVSVIGNQDQEGLADVSVEVEPGDRYDLGNLSFEGASVFPQDVLRRQFPIDTGSLFNATAIAKGLDNLKELYVESGYPMLQ